jgi:hypothetical protein
MVFSTGFKKHSDNSLMGQSSSFGIASRTTRELQVTYIVIGETPVAFVDLVVGEQRPFILQCLVPRESPWEPSEHDDFQTWMSTTTDIC